MEKTNNYIQLREKATKKIKELLVQRLNLPLEPNEIAEDSLLFGLGRGLNSIDTLELVLGIENMFSIRIDETEMASFGSVNTLVDYVVSKRDKWYHD